MNPIQLVLICSMISVIYLAFIYIFFIISVPTSSRSLALIFMLHYFQLLSALYKRIPRSSIISVLDYILVSSPASPSALYSLSAHVLSSSSSFTMRLRNVYVIRLYIHHHHHHKCYAFRQVYDTHPLHSSPPSALLSIYKRVFYMINDSVVVFLEQVVQ